ncbi:uncharacterized protein BJX67DRAFT_350270 [Aspergillus lucknowensis]|uniref:Uncharacterized protein n=1 Tax=Aspergillus lucknowensis TaxID=176173 RepID=A0ABR4LUQ8_9EURO
MSFVSGRCSLSLVAHISILLSTLRCTTSMSVESNTAAGYICIIVSGCGVGFLNTEDKRPGNKEQDPQECLAAWLLLTSYLPALADTLVGPPVSISKSVFCAKKASPLLTFLLMCLITCWMDAEVRSLFLGQCDDCHRWHGQVITTLLGSYTDILLLIFAQRLPCMHVTLSMDA